MTHSYQSFLVLLGNKSRENRENSYQFIVLSLSLALKGSGNKSIYKKKPSYWKSYQDRTLYLYVRLNWTQTPTEILISILILMTSIRTTFILVSILITRFKTTFNFNDESQNFFNSPKSSYKNI